MQPASAQSGWAHSWDTRWNSRTETAATQEKHAEADDDWIELLQLEVEGTQAIVGLPESLLSFLTAPISVQSLSPEIWLQTWRYVCTENDTWLDIRDDEPCCLLCNRSTNFLAHLLSASCKAKRSQHAIRPGPLLLQILNAGEARRIPKDIVRSLRYGIACSGVDSDDELQ